MLAAVAPVVSWSPSVVGRVREEANLQANAAAAGVELSAAEFTALEQAAPAGVAPGERYSPQGMQPLHH